MFKRFTEWWKKKPEGAHRESEIVYDEYYNEHEKEWKYETTLKEDLKIISEYYSTLKKFDEMVEYYRIYKDENLVSFSTDISMDTSKGLLGLSSAQVAIDTFHRSYLHGRSVPWKASYEEFRQVYQLDIDDFRNEVLLPSLELVGSNYNNNSFYYIFSKYEDSINIALNAIKDSIEHNGEITNEIFQKSKIIFNKLYAALLEKQKEIDYVVDLQHKAVKKSIENRLDAEIEYMEQFLEV